MLCIKLSVLICFSQQYSAGILIYTFLRVEPNVLALNQTLKDIEETLFD